MGIFERFEGHADRLNQYFLAAVKAYLIKGDEAAGWAAFSSGVVAASLQRTSMTAYLQRFSGELQNNSSMVSGSPDEFRARALMAAKLDVLSSRIAAKEWSMSDCVAAKQHLRDLDRDYYEAQGRADPTVFYRRYPDLFEEAGQPPAKPISCPKCGSSNDTNWKYCGSCGAPLHLSGVQGTGLFCTACGNKVDAGWGYCGECGAKQPVPSKLGQQQAQPPAQHVIAAGPKTCPNCGLINPQSSGRCDCGYVFKDDEANLRQLCQELGLDPELWEFLTVPDMTIIGDYGGLLARLSRERPGQMLLPVSLLLHPKAAIKEALETGLRLARTEALQSHLKSVRLRLDDFIPDAEVPQDLQQNREEWFKRKNWNDPLCADVLVEGLRENIQEAPAFQERAERQGDGHELIQAAAEPNLAAVERILESGAEVNVQDKHGMTALMFATLRGDTAISQLLLSKGCDPNLRNQDGATALITASTQGDVPIVRLLLEHRADPNVKMDDGTTALYWALQFGQQETVQLLLAHGAKPTRL